MEDQQLALVPQEGITPTENLHRLGKEIRKCVLDEHNFIVKYNPTFDSFFDPANIRKNRFLNTLLYDATRVPLNDCFTSQAGDYAHASYVDGFDKQHQYLLAQAPFSHETEFDLWRLVAQEAPSCLVVLNTVAQNEPSQNKAKSKSERSKNDQANQECNDSNIRQFWPSFGSEKTFGDGGLRLHNDETHQSGEFDTHDIIIKQAGVHMPLLVKLLAYRNWFVDADVPVGLAQFLTRARLCAQQMEQKMKDVEAPMMIICATGVHRSGTFTALDILFRRIQQSRRVALEETVNQLRAERYGCVQLLEHYFYLCESIVHYAVSANCVNADEIEGDLATYDLKKTSKSDQYTESNRPRKQQLKKKR